MPLAGQAWAVHHPLSAGGLAAKAGRGGLRLLQPPQSVESVVHLLKIRCFKSTGFFYQCNLVTEKDFALRYDKATINKQERGGQHENQAQSRLGDCQYEKEYGFSLNGKRS